MRALKIGLATAILSLCFFTGCGKEKVEIVPNENATSEYKEHLDLSISYWQIEDALSDRENDKVLKILEDKFNVTIEPINVTWDDYYEKIKLWSQTDSLPDIFVGAYRSEKSYFDWINEGLLKEIPKDLSIYPNLQKYMDSPETDTCMIDGKTYCIFRQTYSEQAETVKDRTILYRWDLANAAGITKEPETWDEFRNMIQAIIKADPENNGIKGMTAKGYSMLSGLLFTYSIPMGSTGGSSFYWVKQGDKYVPAIFAGDYLGETALPTWHLIRDMYNEGTIEKDIVLATTSQAEDKFLQGKSAAICIDAGISNTKTFENMGCYWNDIHGRDFFDDVKSLKLMPDVNGNIYYPVWDYAWSETYINSKVSDEKLNRILAIYDYLLSDEGILLSNFGIENETYIVNDDKSISLTDKGYPHEIYPSIKMLASLVCWNYGNKNSYRYPNILPEEYVLADVERVNEARKCSIPQYQYSCTKNFHQSGMDFTIDINNIFQRIMVSEEPVEILWNDIIEEYKEKGLMDVVETVNQMERDTVISPSH